MLLTATRLPALDAERVRLRWLTPDDAPALLAVFGDPEVCRYWSRPALVGIDDARALQQEIVRLFEQRTLFQWGIAERATDAIVGTCTLASLSEEHRRAEVGFALARGAWGRGYMTEALPAIIEFAFTTLDLRRLEADVDPRNVRSIRVLERTGFRREGYLRERYLLNDEVQDAVLYGLLRADWRRSYDA